MVQPNMEGRDMGFELKLDNILHLTERILFGKLPNMLNMVEILKNTPKQNLVHLLVNQKKSQHLELVLALKLLRFFS